MSVQNEIGKKGEDIAVKYLKNLSYEIIETNWRYSKAEIDIIAKDGEELVFVEVKTRSYDYFGRPEESVDAHKEAMIAEGAAAYMRQTGYEWIIRFDIISILLRDPQNPEIEHFRDAFFPGID